MSFHAGGKVILFGEHAVVYGHPALAAGIALGVTARVEAAESSRMCVEPWGLDLGIDDDSPLARAFAALMTSYEGAAQLDLQVDLPGGAGLGCSAAMGVAACGALDAHFGVERSPEERGEHTLRWEKVFHGNPSGVDNMMASCGGVAIYRKGKPLERITPRKPLPLVIAHSGESSSTKEVVEMVARQHARETERVDEAFDAIDTLIRNAKLALEAGDTKSVGQLMTLNQRLLASLMLSTEKIETLCRAAEEAGALGAKLTGAGAGGCVIALAEDDDHLVEVEAAMRPHASMTFATHAGVRASS